MNVKYENGVASRTDLGPARLWFGLLGGAVAWLTHLMLAYVVSEFGCVGSLGQHLVLGLSVVAWLLLLVSAATLIAAMAATAAAYRAERQLKADRTAHPDAVPAGWIHTARTGWITSGLFALVIAVESVPIFYYLKDC